MSRCRVNESVSREQNWKDPSLRGPSCKTPELRLFSAETHPSYRGSAGRSPHYERGRPGVGAAGQHAGVGLTF